ncbi:MAG: PKD domain-containing protein, partial [Rhodopila sp.]|nr:PKD domain-containing protein [Rhodopila sp.]
LTLQAKFSDPGWLDTHAAFWDFGDCTGPQRAVVRETHKPPAGEGVGIASHTYIRCGTYFATCVVIDDDGAIGKTQTTISVVDICNPGFEEGFCIHNAGSVGNHWMPYVAAMPMSGGNSGLTTPGVGAPGGGDVFEADEYRVHSGRRSQRIQFIGRARAGVLQRVGANKGWDYQISAWYSLNEQAGGVSQLLKDIDTAADLVPPDATGGVARLGIDPAGGQDPSAPGVVWMDGFLRPDWAQLSVRATATGDAITIFMEAAGFGRLGADAFFDDAALQAVQPFCPPEKPKNNEICVDFSDVSPGHVPADYVKDGFHFVARDQQPQQIADTGPPVGQNKLVVRPRGLAVALPFTADAVSVTVSDQRQIPVTIVASDAQNNIVGRATTSSGEAVQTLQIAAAGIVAVVVTADGDTAVVKVCAHQQSSAKS